MSEKDIHHEVNIIREGTAMTSTFSPLTGRFSESSPIMRVTPVAPTAESRALAAVLKQQHDEHYSRFEEKISDLKNDTFLKVADVGFIPRENISSMVEYIHKIQSDLGGSSVIESWTGASSKMITASDYMMELEERKSREDTPEEAQQSIDGPFGRLLRRMQELSRVDQLQSGSSVSVTA